MIRTILVAIALSCSSAASAQQMERVPDRTAAEGEGPFARLVIHGAMMIDGTGAPPMGPVDITVEGDRISAITRAGATPPQADRVIDATGMFVMPGMVDAHGHNGDPSKAPQPAYGYHLWLAHGVTSVRGVSFYDEPATGLSDAARSEANTITAPRLFTYAVFGSGWGQPSPTTPQGAREWVRWAAGQGYWGIKFFNQESPAVLAAALDEAEAQQLGTVAHLAQAGVAQVTARRAVELGLDDVTHFYGHFESLLRNPPLVDYPADYNMFDEQSRFAWVARLNDQIVEPGSDEWDEYIDFLVENDVTLSPTFNIYAASRDVMRARTFEWHERYTIPSLMDFYAPSLINHGSYYYDWSTEDEVAWRNFYATWMRMTREFAQRGGRVTAGSDPGFIYQTWGFAFVGELEMLREAGFSPLEVIQIATINGAREIYEARGEEPPMGTLQVGQLADIVVVPANPLENLKVLYGTGHQRLNRETNQIETVGGVRWTIKDGIVYDAPALLEYVAQMVEAQRAAAP